MIKLKRVFEDILDNTFPDSDKLEAYKKVYVETIDKNMKSFHGDYDGRTKKIRIFNLYRSDASLVATSIHELAHHVDHCNRNISDHSKEFYEVFEKLLVTALNMGLFTTEEFLESNRDASDSNKIAAMIKRYVPEKVDYKSDMVTVSVKGGYEKKDILKENGYSWNAALKAWEKDVSSDDEEKEQIFLEELGLTGEIRPAQKFSMSRGTSIIALKGSFDIKDFLKEEGFFFDKKIKGWKKPGTKKDLEFYRKKYPEVEWKIG